MTSEPIVDLHVIQQGSHATEGDLGAIIFNLVASIVSKWWIFKLLKWMSRVTVEANL
jgi:hypothetical protein